MVEPLLSDGALWYGLARVRVLPLVFVAIVGCGGGGNIVNLPLRWQGVEELPRASPDVARAFAAAPISFGLRDMRQDPTAVGRYEDNGFVVRTSDNVGQYCTDRMGDILVHAGARLNQGTPAAAVEAELLSYEVVEGGRFNGKVEVRAIVRRGAAAPWTRTYTGTSTRWGRTHSPENFNEGLSNSLTDAAAQLLHDADFARALGAPVPPPAGASGI